MCARKSCTKTHLEKLVVFVTELESMEVSQHRDGERLSKSPGPANELNICPVLKLRDTFRLVEICYSREPANVTEVRFAQGKAFQLAGYHELRARWRSETCAACHERNSSMAARKEGRVRRKPKGGIC